MAHHATETAHELFHQGKAKISSLSDKELQHFLMSIGSRFLSLSSEKAPLEPPYAELFTATPHPDTAFLIDSLRWLLNGISASGDISSPYAEFLLTAGQDFRKFGLHTAQHYTALAEAITAEAVASGIEGMSNSIHTICSILATGATEASVPAASLFYLTEVHRRTPHVTVVRGYVDPPLPYWPGQYIETRTPYTPAIWRKLSPAIPFNSRNIVEFHIHSIGIFSQSIADNAVTGDRWVLANPYGDLHIPSIPHVVAICGSTGLAPIRSLILDLAERESDLPQLPTIDLYIGAKNSTELYDADYLRGLELSLDWLTVTTVVENASSTSANAIGLVGDIALQRAQWKDSAIIIAGSPDMKAQTLKNFQEAGARDEQFQFDLPD